VNQAERAPLTATTGPALANRVESVTLASGAAIAPTIGPTIAEAPRTQTTIARATRLAAESAAERPDPIGRPGPVAAVPDAARR